MKKIYSYFGNKKKNIYIKIIALAIQEHNIQFVYMIKHSKQLKFLILL